jgi:hypothetical protein
MLLEGRAAEPLKEDERTAGVSVDVVDVEGVGEVSMWDYAGHSEFYLTHELFLVDSTALFIVVCSLKNAPDARESAVMYWVRFIRTRFVASANQHRPIVLLVGTNKDDPHSMVQANAHTHTRVNLIYLIATIYLFSAGCGGSFFLVPKLCACCCLCAIFIFDSARVIWSRTRMEHGQLGATVSHDTFGPSFRTSWTWWIRWLWWTHASQRRGRWLR